MGTGSDMDSVACFLITPPWSGLMSWDGGWGEVKGERGRKGEIRRRGGGGYDREIKRIN